MAEVVWVPGAHGLAAPPAIQRIQRGIPRIILGRMPWSRIAMRILTPLVRLGVAQRFMARCAPIFARDVADARLEV